jgi:hypothetical protein
MNEVSKLLDKTLTKDLDVRAIVEYNHDRYFWKYELNKRGRFFSEIGEDNFNAAVRYKKLRSLDV